MTFNKPDTYKSLETIAVLAMASTAIGVLLHRDGFLWGSFALLFVGVFIGRLSRIIAWGWLAFAQVLGTINSRIILTVLFYLVLTPVALLHRMFKGDFLKLKRGRHGDSSMWVERNHRYGPRDLENVW